MRASSGLILTLASIAGTIPTPGLSIYGATKAALIAWTNSLNREEAEHGIRATALCPAFVATPMTDWTGLAAEEMIQPEDIVELVARAAPPQPEGARPDHRRRAGRRRGVGTRRRRLRRRLPVLQAPFSIGTSTRFPHSVHEPS